MYKFLDLNLNEIPFPEGVMPLDIFVGSISKVRETEQIPGRAGVMNYGVDYESRPINVTMLADGADKLDYRPIRNDVYDLLDQYDEFYVQETDLPSRVLKVAVDESFMPDRKTITAAEFDIPLRTLDSVFWESTYTTLDLHDSGYSSTAEKYGLVDNIDDEKVQYRFDPSIGTINLATLSYDYGFINGSGVVSQIGTGSYTINTGFINIIPGVEYLFVDEGDHPRVAYWWLIQYDIDQNFIERTAINSSGEGKNYTFTAKGSKLKIMLNPTSPVTDNRIPPSRVGNDVLPRLKTKASTQRFSVYNAGNVPIEPESMFLEIEVHGVYSIGNLKIINHTTGEEFALKKSAKGFNLRLHGLVVTQGGSINIFRDTNHQFISLAPGVNQFETTGGAFDHITFNFKFYYK